MRGSIGLLFLVLFGIAARLIWPADMEWKTDEKLLWDMALDVARTGTFPAEGIKSGGGIANPGMSVEVFGAIAFFTKDPMRATQVVQWTNVIALLGFFWIARRYFQGEERTAWNLGLVLAAVNPLAVLFSRKLWAQDLLPLFALLIVLGHLERRRAWGAVLWGAAGALMGQVHMSGFFLALGLVVVSVAHDRANGRPLRWISWSVGSLIGGLTLLPWLWSLAHAEQATTTSFKNMLQLNFFFYWLIDPLGLDMMYSLRSEFWSFLRGPLVAGVPTFIVGLAHVLLLLVTGVVVRELVLVVRSTWRWAMDLPRASAFFQGMSGTRLYLWGILLGLGIGMPLAGVTIYQHYLICTFPFAFIFLAMLLKKHPRILSATMVAQAVITLCFLWYVHRNGGAPEGDYGTSYRAQLEREER